jgi:hypothetical protein
VVFLQEPGNVAEGANFSPAVTVQVEDQFGNVVTSSSASVALTIQNNPGSGTLAGTTSINAVSGVATFSALSINNSGLGYALTASSGSLTPATSSAFNITGSRFSVASANWSAAGTTWARTSGGSPSGVPEPGPADAVTIEGAFTVTVDLAGEVCAGMQLGSDAAGTITFAGSGSPSLTVSGSVTAGTNAGTTRTGNITFTSGSTLTAGSLTLGGSGTSPAPGTISMTAGGTLSVGGSITVNTVTGNTWTPGTTGTGTLVLTANNTLPGATIFTNFNNLTIAANTTTLGAAITVNGNLTIDSGATFTTANDAVTFDGNFSNSGTVNAGSSSITLGGAATQAIDGFTTTGTMTITKTGGTVTFGAVAVSVEALTLNGNLTMEGGTLATATGDTNAITVNAGDTLTLVGGSVSTASGTGMIGNGNFTITGGTFSAGTSDDHTAGSDITLAGTVNINGGEVIIGQNFAPTGMVNLNGGLMTIGHDYAPSATPGNITATGGTVEFQGSSGSLAFSSAGTYPFFNVVVEGGASPNFNNNENNVIAISQSLTLNGGGTPVPFPTGNGSTTGSLFLGTSQQVAGVWAGQNAPNNNSTYFSGNGQITVAYGAASQIVFTMPPGGGSVYTAWAQQPVVTLEDANGNAVMGTAQTVTLAIQNNAGPGGTLSGTLAVAVNTSTGTATFSGLSIDKLGNGYRLTATGSTVDATAGTVVSSGFNITAGAATQLVITGNGTQTAGASQNLTITAEDAYGNTATSYTGSKNLTFSGASSSGNSATAPTVVNNSGTAIPFGSSTAITFSSGMATVVNPSSIGAPTAMTGVKSTTSGKTLSITTPAVAVNNTIIVTVSSESSNPGNITVNDTQGNSYTEDGGSTNTFSPFVCTYIFSATVTTALSSGNTITVTFGNNVTDKDANAFYVSGLSLSTPADRNGTGSGGNTAGTTATAGPSGATSLTNELLVGAIAMAAAPTSASAGAGYTAIGAFQNSTGSVGLLSEYETVSSIGTYSATGTWTPAELWSASIVTYEGQSAENGVMTLYDAQTATISATDGTIGSAGTDDLSVTVSASTAARLGMTTSPGGTLTGGTAFGTQPVVAVLDQYGNTVTGSSASIALAITGGTPTSGGPGTLSGTTSVSASSGVATFSGLSINTSGNGYKLTATSPGLTSTNTAAFNISVGPAAQLVFTTSPGGTLTGGTAFGTQPVVKVEDAGGNIVTSSSESISLAIASGTPATGGPGTLSGTTTVSASSGVATFSGLSINTAGTAYKLTATGTELSSANSSAFTISVGAAVKLAYSVVPSTGTAGTAFSVTVQSQDAGGNPSDPTSSTTITLSKATGGGTLSGTLTGTIGTSANSVTISTPVYSKADTMTLTATATAGETSLTAVTSGNIVFSAGVATQLVYTSVPSTGTAGTAFSVTVQSQDANGNPSSPTSTTTITLSKATGGGTLSGTLTGTITTSGNSVTISTPVYSKADTMTLTATATGGETSLTAVTSGNIVFSAGVATHLAYSSVPSTGTAGTAFSVTVQSQDANGNPSSPTSTTTITLSKATGGGTLSGTLTGSIGTSATSVTISTPVYSKADTMTLTATATAGETSLTAVTSGNIVFSAGVATQLVYTSVPSTGTAGTAFSVTVQSQDANGNPSSPTSTTTITLSKATGGGTLSGTLTGSIGTSANSVTISTPVYSFAGTMTLTATATAGETSLTACTSGNIVFSPGGPPVANAAGYSRAKGADIQISVTNLLAQFTSDAYGDAVGLVSVAGGLLTNNLEIAVTTNGSVVYYATSTYNGSPYIVLGPTNLSSHYTNGETFPYVVEDTSYPTETATNYITITVTNAVGQATGGISITNGVISTTWAGIPGTTNLVQRSSAITGPWTNIATVAVPTAGLFTNIDTSPPAGGAFYRLQQF